VRSGRSARELLFAENNHEENNHEENNHEENNHRIIRTGVNAFRRLLNQQSKLEE
jgi:hypothetical protein